MNERPALVHRPGEPAPKHGSWEEIGPAECPILYRRTLVSNRWFKLLVHRFVPGASDAAPHDHPRSFLTFVLRGGYDDVQPCEWCRGSRHLSIPGSEGYAADGWLVRERWKIVPCQECRGPEGDRVDEVRAPTIRFRSAEHIHITNVGPKGATTFVIMGPPKREWGFWKDGKWTEWRLFEKLHGLNWRCPE